MKKWCWILVPTACLLTVVQAQATTHCSWTRQFDGVLFGRLGKYDAYPTHLFHNGVHRIWFCGLSAIDGELTNESDAIYYITKSGTLSAGGWTSPLMVLNITQIPFGSNHVCDPSVVLGNFSYNGTAYSHVMFLTADTNANGGVGVDGVVGVAYSNNGKMWTVHPQPVLEPPFFDASYGAGESGAAWLNNEIYHVYWDTPAGGEIYLTRTVDGINHTAPAPTQIGNYGFGASSHPNNAADIAYDPTTQRWYAIVNTDDAQGNALSTVRVLQSTTQDILGAWEVIATYDRNFTGYPWQHNPTLAKKADTTLYRDTNGWAHVLFEVGTGDFWNHKSWDIASGRFRRICSITSP